MKKLKPSFYMRSSLEVAKDLLGKHLVHIVNDTKLVGKIVEVEAYMGPFDKAAHSYNNRRTKRNEAMYGPGGHAYIYLIYGMYYCLNVVTNEINIPEGVLIRALEPIEGHQQMALNRFNKPFDKLSNKEFLNLTSGPGKLTKAFDITLKQYGQSFNSETLYILDAPLHEQIKESPRINIDYAEEARFYPWRFYLDKNKFVSK
ncbi:MAG TPA: DNA-3-methyladenine glycosylase [Acholeplasmataceae bacterium]|jgi:DNA-3-methyladenine glycosylase|nr:DNA-3-methyladenine glycosylase [Acholeplasmataceae bacterium]